MKVDQLFIFPAPRIGTAVIRIGKATDARFVAIINRRRARPCHLHDNSLQKHCFFYIMICRLCAETVRSADTMVCSGQKIWNGHGWRAHSWQSTRTASPYSLRDMPLRPQSCPRFPEDPADNHRCASPCLLKTS